MSVGAVGYPGRNYSVPGAKAQGRGYGVQGAAAQGSGVDAGTDSRALFGEAVQKFNDEKVLTAQELREKKDWRDMSDAEWGRLLKNVDEYIADYREYLERMKEMQDEAAQKASAQADAGTKAIAAQSAALIVAANGGFVDSEEEAEAGCDNDWTRNLKTDDQEILRTAKKAQEVEETALLKLQEMQLTGDTSVGVAHTDGVTECAAVTEDETEDKIWTITAFGEDGIISKKFKDGEVIEQWEIKYTDSASARKVWDFIDRFDEKANLTFTGDKSFWEDFLSGKIDEDSVVKEYASKRI